MYVTRPLSLYRNSPASLSAEPPEGPYTGVLVITDEEAEVEDSYCFGLCKRRSVKRLPFPSDKKLGVTHLSDYRETSVTKVLFIPVIDQPLAANRYYVVAAKGRRKGKAWVCSKATDKCMCCFTSYINDKSPKPLNHTNVYQHFKINRHHNHTFFAKSIAQDGIPPKFLRTKGWEIRSSRLYRSKLKEALGLDTSLRPCLPDFNFPVSRKSSGLVVVGEWYCPFMFVKESCRGLKSQMKKSTFYKITLEQSWEQIHYCENIETNTINMITIVEKETNSVFGMKAAKEKSTRSGGFYWFRPIYIHGRGNRRRGNRFSLGLSYAVVEKMRWVMEEGGWVGGGASRVKVERMEERANGEKRFGCYVLMESFVMRRLDGTLLLKCDFRHVDKIRCKWE